MTWRRRHLGEIERRRGGYRRSLSSFLTFSFFLLFTFFFLAFCHFNVPVNPRRQLYSSEHLEGSEQNRRRLTPPPLFFKSCCQVAFKSVLGFTGIIPHDIPGISAALSWHGGRVTDGQTYIQTTAAGVVMLVLLIVLAQCMVAWLKTRASLLLSWSTLPTECPIKTGDIIELNCW